MHAALSWLKFLLLAHLTFVVVLGHAWAHESRTPALAEPVAEDVMVEVVLSELAEQDAASVDPDFCAAPQATLPCWDDDRGDPHPVACSRWPQVVSPSRLQPRSALAAPGPWLRLPLRPPQSALT